MENEMSIIDPKVQIFLDNKHEGFTFQERRHEDWLENYTLSRDKVRVNRIEQRQSVNLPIMKTVLKTLMKDVDDLPVLYFENLDNDKEAEIFKNEYWKVTGEENKFEIQDIVDKRQVFHFGRSFDQWQIIDGKIVMTIIDPIDIKVSRYTESTNIHSSPYLIHEHIYVKLSDVEMNPEYDKDAVAKLKEFYATEQGLIKLAENEQSLLAKNEKLTEMGVPDMNDPILGEAVVELALHFVKKPSERDVDKDGKAQSTEIYLQVIADDNQILQDEPLEDVIGVTEDHFWRTHYPYNTWADDVEKQDFWSDGVADMVRTPNKVVNAWFSQMTENNAMKNLNMQVYDSTKVSDAGFHPETWDPKAWGWYGIPGNPNEIYKQLEVADLSDNMNQINFILDIIWKGSGATSTQQGEVNERSITLGEVQLALANAKERIKGMSKFYTQVWKERGLMFTKLIEAGHDKLDATKIYKKGRNTDTIYSRDILPEDWMTKSGYRCRVWDQNEKNENDMQSLEKISAVSANIPGNPKLEEIKQRKMLEFAGLKPEEVNDVMEIEQQKREAAASVVNAQSLPPGGLLPTGTTPQLPNQPMALPAGQPVG